MMIQEENKRDSFSRIKHSFNRMRLNYLYIGKKRFPRVIEWLKEMIASEKITIGEDKRARLKG